MQIKVSIFWITWIALSVVIMVVSAVFFVAWIMSSPGSSEEKAKPVARTTVKEEPDRPAETNQPEATQDQVEERDVSANPGGSGESPSGLVVQFPDPISSGGRTQPQGSQQDIYGQWIIEMYGGNYGFNNLYLNLEKAGIISSPMDYIDIFDIVKGQFLWSKGKPEFKASLQVVLKLGSNQMVPVDIELSGMASETMEEIEGDFSAVPQNEVYAAYGQRGSFKMQR